MWYTQTGPPRLAGVGRGLFLFSPEAGPVPRPRPTIRKLQKHEIADVCSNLLVSQRLKKPIFWAKTSLIRDTEIVEGLLIHHLSHGRLDLKRSKAVARQIQPQKPNDLREESQKYDGNKSGTMRTKGGQTRRFRRLCYFRLFVNIISCSSRYSRTC
ncbi:hypothetical protein J6590_014089 [Homalodisca vitripennis]|nr:hypothetical protein J6590_014089 [Homalodisca vitripennis]